MPDLDHHSIDELRAELRRVDSAKAAQRLMVAIAYEDGASQTELARRYGYSRKTVYNWLKRVEERPLGAELEDEPRPGRPPRLSREERRQLAEALRSPPDEFGYDAADWTPGLVRRHVRRSFDVTYTRRTARKLLRQFE